MSRTKQIIYFYAELLENNRFNMQILPHIFVGLLLYLYFCSQIIS